MSEHERLVYKDMLSPVGFIRLIATDTGLAAILWEGEDYTRTKLPAPERDDQAVILLQTEQQLKEYFDKKRRVFDIPLDFRGTAFQIRVWEALLNIPYGVTKTYGELARLLGDIKAVRAVGGALNKNPISIVVPCHRVVGAAGKLVGFAGGLDNKSILLDLENEYKAPTLF
ncbi:methylated-DNA-[protein]-cysteine S-methyltransferase [Filimonas lacunae]|uniref:Methylated-DNA--protein-cysteine methyltransferase n=1 Tax=Filimonas lacunae TaxID=477680 RepID=A0A173MKC7_9BACT|nr:methylated-DNA--[protein]-cysteine S-methyltransferase [Filimonas lacunae]BAV07927.1 methylated-DNA--protein-cysteine S-methyltransferase [Filimonas lacunae]SIT06667.1 methylated-DNA-[protein]-cysteine S-methyltransferase [Filimonas lacunae]